MPQNSARVELPFIQPSQAQKHVTHNEALQRLDAVVQLCLQGFAEETPPALPNAGDTYGLGAAPSGVWAGHPGEIAYWDGEVWLFSTPGEGWRAWGVAEQALRVWQGTAWGPVVTALQDLTLLGVGTQADATNRLAVVSDAALFSHAGAGHQIKVNKAATGDTASLLFQTGWTGHAEIGLTGDNALSFKTSADGLTWNTSLKADPQTGQIALAPQAATRLLLSDSGLVLDVPVTGSAVQANAADTTPGRLLGVGAFGLGDTAINLTSGNEATQGGIWRFETTDTDKPGPSNSAGVIWSARWAASTAMQIAMIHFPTAFYGRMYMRILSGTWGDWEPIHTARSTVGTVSQVGGVPTGSIIERGSNANGDYVRYAGGTQICWRSNLGVASLTGAGPLYKSAGVSWSFPAAFAAGSVPVVSGQADQTGRWLAPGAAGIGSVTIGVFGDAATTTAFNVRLMAVGRWY